MVDAAPRHDATAMNSPLPHSLTPDVTHGRRCAADTTGRLNFVFVRILYIAVSQCLGSSGVAKQNAERGAVTGRKKRRWTKLPYAGRTMEEQTVGRK
ncbi:hypothetical protein J6590_026893 [Homalodisca vitripennis]|nr:hypothetical protein J6590_026893 [Homalodisca vitripennis]